MSSGPMDLFFPNYTSQRNFSPPLEQMLQNCQLKKIIYFQLWLKRKNNEQNLDSDTSQELGYSTETASDDGNDNNNNNDDEVNEFYRKHWPAMDNKTAFSQWLEEKKDKQRENSKYKGNKSNARKGRYMIESKSSIGVETGW